MTDSLRVSLAVATEPRDPNNLSKDSCLDNCFIDRDPIGTIYVVKRPGFLVSAEGITTGLNRGIFYYPNPVTGEPGIAYINTSGYVSRIPYLSNFLFGFPYSESETYDVAEGPVYFDEGDGEGLKPFYSAVDNNTGNTPSTTISPGNIYWSPTPFGPARYYGMFTNPYVGGTGATAATKEAAAVSAYSTVFYKTCAGRNPLDGSYHIYSGVDTVNDKIVTIGFVSVIDNAPCEFIIGPYGPAASSIITL